MMGHHRKLPAGATARAHRVERYRLNRKPSAFQSPDPGRDHLRSLRRIKRHPGFPQNTSPAPPLRG